MVIVVIPEDELQNFMSGAARAMGGGGLVVVRYNSNLIRTSLEPRCERGHLR